MLAIYSCGLSLVPMTSNSVAITPLPWHLLRPSCHDHLLTSILLAPTPAGTTPPATTLGLTVARRCFRRDPDSRVSFRLHWPRCGYFRLHRLTPILALSPLPQSSMKELCILYISFARGVFGWGKSYILFMFMMVIWGSAKSVLCA